MAMQKYNLKWNMYPMYSCINKYNGANMEYFCLSSGGTHQAFSTERSKCGSNAFIRQIFAIPCYGFIFSCCSHICSGVLNNSAPTTTHKLHKHFPTTFHEFQEQWMPLWQIILVKEKIFLKHQITFCQCSAESQCTYDGGNGEIHIRRRWNCQVSKKNRRVLLDELKNL